MRHFNEDPEAMRVDEGFIDAKPPQTLDPAARAARLILVRDRLQTCLEELDRLGLHIAGAHLTMALHTVDAAS